MTSARSLYRLNAALAGAASLVVVLGSVAALARVDLARPPAVDLASYCRRLLLPDLTLNGLAVLALAGLGVLVTVRALRSAIRQRRGWRRISRALEVVGDRKLDGTRVLVLAGSRAEAFCAGLLRPRVYLSSGALERLSDAQLRAVIGHEAHHARRRDPLRIFLLRMLGDGLFFLPALSQLTERYREFAEIAADEAALAAVGDASPLAGALLHLGEIRGSGVVAIAPERVDHLLGECRRPRVPLSLVLGAIVSVIGLLAAASAGAYSAAGESVNVALLAARSCMLVMLAVPIVVLAGGALLGRRMIGVHSAWSR